MVAQKGVPLSVDVTPTIPEAAQGFERKVYSTQDVATILGVSKEHIHRLIRAGELPSKRVGRRIVIPCVLFDEWLCESDKR